MRDKNLEKPKLSRKFQDSSQSLETEYSYAIQEKQKLCDFLKEWQKKIGENLSQKPEAVKDRGLLRMTIGSVISPISLVSIEEQQLEQVLIKSLTLSKKKQALVFDMIHNNFDEKGCVVIVKAYHKAENTIDRMSLAVLVQSVVQSVVQKAGGGGRTIKCEDFRCFLFFDTILQAIKVSLGLIKTFEIYSKHPTTKPNRQLELACGAHVGTVIVFQGDFYGDPVNSASKMGENCAEPKELLVTHETYLGLLKEESNIESFGIRFFHKKMEKSNVKFDCVSISATDKLVNTVLPSGLESHKKEKLPIWYTRPIPANEKILLQRLYEPENPQEDEKIRRLCSISDITLLITDMSGFTSLTKKHGILSFLGLVVKQRHIFRDVFCMHKGDLLKYCGDDVIAMFPNSLSAGLAALEVRRLVNEYNSGKEDSAKVSIKISIHHGEVMIWGKNIVGETFEFCEEIAENVAGQREIVISEESMKKIVNEATVPLKMQKKSVVVENKHVIIYELL